MEVVLNKRSGSGSPLSYLQVDANWDAIETAFAAIVAGNSGTVTSVGLGMPAIFAVAGSPITSTGAFAVTLQTQTANKVWASPTTGGAATPTFRALVGDDLPTIPVAKGGTGNTAFTSGRVIVSIASNVIGVSAVTTTELGYLSGITGDVQAQLNAKVGTSDIIAINRGGTGANTAQTARLALLPNVATNALKMLRVNAGATDVEYATLAVGNSGTTPNWANAGTTYTLNIPSAGVGVDRGLVTDLTQTFDGEKTFTSDITLDARTAKQVMYIDATNVLVGRDEYTYDEGTRQIKAGSIRQTTVDTITVSTVLDTSYNFVRCEQGGAIDVTLPTPTIDYLGHVYIVKDSLNQAATRNITVKANGSSRLDNTTGGTIVINTNAGCVGVQCVVTGSTTYVWESIFKS